VQALHQDRRRVAPADIADNAAHLRVLLRGCEEIAIEVSRAASLLSSRRRPGPILPPLRAFQLVAT
jgi:hypothetical protein